MIVASIPLPKQLLDDYLENGSDELKKLVNEYRELGESNTCSYFQAIERHRELAALAAKMRDLAKKENL